MGALGLCVCQNFVNSLLLLGLVNAAGTLRCVGTEHVVHALKPQIVIAAQVDLLLSARDWHLRRQTGGHLGHFLLGYIAGGVAAVQGTLLLVDLLFRAWEV